MFVCWSLVGISNSLMSNTRIHWKTYEIIWNDVNVEILPIIIAHSCCIWAINANIKVFDLNLITNFQKLDICFKVIFYRSVAGESGFLRFPWLERTTSFRGLLSLYQPRKCKKNNKIFKYELCFVQILFIRHNNSLLFCARGRAGKFLFGSP